MVALLCGAALLGCVAVYGAWTYYAVQTPSAVIEKHPLALGTLVPAKVAKVLAEKNEHVAAGQTLIRFAARVGASSAAEAGARVDGMEEEAGQTAPIPPHVSAEAASPDLIAPVDAVVTELFAQPGMWTQPYQELIALMPDVGLLEATAWFPEKDGANIQPGQFCRVFILDSPEKSFSDLFGFFGTVERVLPAGSLSPRFPLAAQTRLIPVRVRFSVNDPESNAGLKSGMRAAVRVHTFTLPLWARIGAPTGLTGK